MLCTARTMLSQDVRLSTRLSVRPSVCLSVRHGVTRRYYVETAKHVILSDLAKYSMTRDA